MRSTIDCVLTVVILILTVMLLRKRGYFNGNPREMVSNPGVAAAIGNAANRHFENSQAMLEPARGYYGQPVPSTPPRGFPQVTVRGYAQDMPEKLVDWGM